MRLAFNRSFGAAAAAAPGEAEQPKHVHKWLVLAVVMIGSFMAPFDSSVVYMALPKLTNFFGVAITTVEWVVVAYLLVTSTFLLTCGRMGDMFGLKRMYLLGFAIFTVASVACAAAWSIWSLVGFRVVQAMGSSMFLALGPAIITHAFPVRERGKALGFVGIAVSAGLTLGPNLGGLILGLWGWRWIFLVNVPVGIAVLLLGARVLQRESSHKQEFDPLGAVFSFAALFPLLLLLSKGEAWGWEEQRVGILLVLSLLGAFAFVFTELHVSQPVLELRLFRIRLFTAPLVSAMASYVVTATVLFVMPFYLLEVRGLSPEYAGLLVTPVPLMTAVVGPLSGALSDRIGSRFLSTLGLLVSAAGVASLSSLGTSTGPGGVLARLAVIGLGMGLFQSPNSSALMGSVPRARLGVASGMVAMGRSLGMVLGVSVAGMVLAVRRPSYFDSLVRQLPEELAHREALLHAAHDAVLVAAAICFLGAFMSLARGRPPGEQT